MRIPAYVLEHTVDIERPTEYGTSYGPTFEAVVEDVAALVVDKSELVIDGRSEGETYGQQVLSTAQVLMQPEDYVAPGGRITVDKGTPMQRRLAVVAAARLEHTIAPSQARAWLM
jgi:hypothetical protein